MWRHGLIYAALATIFAIFTAAAVLIDRYRRRAEELLVRLEDVQNSLDEQKGDNELVDRFIDLYLPAPLRADVRDSTDAAAAKQMMDAAFYICAAGAALAVAVAVMVPRANPRGKTGE